ncbi:MAG TPA: methyltransferase, partial [Chryseolinea sp.]|nr:methyltransferase [Chryseolinea sp.]
MLTPNDLKRTDPPLQDPTIASTLRERIMGFRNTQLIAVAAKLNVAEYLIGGSKSAKQLSNLLHVDERSLYRLLRALSSLGIFEEKENETFVNTPASELLLESKPGSLRSVAILYGEEWIWHAYGELLYSIENGTQAFERVHGIPLYKYLQHNRDAATVFNNAMTAYSGIEADAIVNAYDFSPATMIVDVGGGEGRLVSALVSVNPGLSGVVFDLPAVKNGEPDSNDGNLRIKYVYGDFFEGVPTGGDIYILKSVLHNWDDASCIKILQNCRAVMKGNSRLVVIERIVSSGNEKSEAKLF